MEIKAIDHDFSVCSVCKVKKIDPIYLGHAFC